MTTATKKDRDDAGRWAPRAFRVFEDNAGDYHWMIVSETGDTLAQSGSYTSFEDAECAAGLVRNGAATAVFEPRPPDARALVVV